jgi:beta-phosphoglucomutase-like phosphatase (HAD superfamily)
MTTLKALIFALDGVLTDTAEYLGWQRLADEQGISFDRDVGGRPGESRASGTLAGRQPRSPPGCQRMSPAEPRLACRARTNSRSDSRFR